LQRVALAIWLEARDLLCHPSSHRPRAGVSDDETQLALAPGATPLPHHLHSLGWRSHQTSPSVTRYRNALAESKRLGLHKSWPDVPWNHLLLGMKLNRRLHAFRVECCQQQFGNNWVFAPAIDEQRNDARVPDSTFRAAIKLNTWVMLRRTEKLLDLFSVNFERSVRYFIDCGRERRVKRQRSAKTRCGNEKPRTTKSLGVRYAELLRLREAIEKSQSDVRVPSPADHAVPKQDRAIPYH
jgi:hypothetical protein